ncbi:hypothetical protein Tco_1348441, partial [Tanacetum coccineum]
TMAGVDINTLTMEQYLALSQENQAPGVVKLEIRGNVNFEIKSQFMRELREDTFFGNKNEDATITLIGSSASLVYLIFPELLKTRSCFEFFLLLLPELRRDGWTDSPRELLIPGISSKRPLSKGIAHYPRLQSSLKIFTTSSKKVTNHYTNPGSGIMTCYTSALLTTLIVIKRNVGSSSSSDGLAALISKMDNLGRDMKKLKEGIHAIQVGCQICEGPHLDKDCPLNEELKHVEEVRYGEFGRTTPFNGSNEGKFCVGPPGYYTKTDNRPPYGERRQSLKELLTKHQEESARRSLK